MRLVRSSAKSSASVLAAAAFGMWLAPGAAHAQTARSAGAPNAQMLQQMQQLASERTSLQAENAKLKKDLEDLRKERDSLKSGQQALERRTKAAESSLKSLQESADQHRQSGEQELTQSRAKMQELVTRFRETLQTLSQVEAEGSSAKQTLATRDRELKTCIDRNLALYRLNEEVLTRFEKQGLFSRVAQAEPFTQIKRVQLENLIDEYKARAEDQRAAPATQLLDAPGAHPTAAPASRAVTTPSPSAVPVATQAPQSSH